MPEGYVDSKPLHRENGDGERIGTAYRLDEVPEGVYIKNDKLDGFVLLEYEEENILWKVQGHIDGAEVIDEDERILVVEHGDW